MSLMKSKEGGRRGTVPRVGYQPNLSRIRIKILKCSNTQILKYSSTQILKYSSEQGWISAKAQLLSKASLLLPSETWPVLLGNIKLAGNPSQSLLLAGSRGKI